MPLLIGQGLADVVVYPEVNETYVDERCAAGPSLEYWRVPDRDHGGIVAPDSPITDELVAWTQDRVDGTPQAAAANGDERPAPTTSATAFSQLGPARTGGKETSTGYRWT